ncbi:MAG: PilC/PilY family type IV pilus protein [Woeseiaceae bacterium]|nr:PilC/PilY family type IV pilus protein [Woeseiaceae bacterium]
MMNKYFNRASWMSAGALFAVCCGSPVLADDTELLLLNPTADIDSIPNVMLIIDSSGSMGDPVETREVYNHTQDYSGGSTPCNTDYLYWSEFKKIVPSCDAANTKRILKTAFVCDHATRQLEGIGLYRQKVAQFRDGGSGFLSLFLGLDAVRWQALEPGNETDIVECRKDRNIHGDGVDTSALYAQKGGDVEPFTADKSEEVDWNSWPTNQSITFYDGNYLNYRENPVVINDEKIDVVNNVAKAILNSISGINVGIMRFNDNEGGPVILDIQDLDANRADILAKINGIAADGATPVSETLYEAARFWRGLPAYYGENVSEHDTDPAALISEPDDPEVYERPVFQACAKNFNVLLTDGEPVDDAETPDIVGNLPDWNATLGYDGCTGTNEGDCLDDIAAYLANVDVSSDGSEENVVTHTIGFDVNLPILREAALRGEGDYFLADDVESLTIALLEVFNDITDRSLSFAAPAVAVNTFNRTRNLNDIYLTTFAARETFRWPGNVKKYEIKDGLLIDKYEKPAINPEDGLFYPTATSFWSSDGDGNDVEAGGAVENMPDPASRNLYVNQTADNDLTAGANGLTVANKDTFSLADFGLTGAPDEPTKEQLIRWARGEDVQDEDLNPSTTARKFMGDPLHSQPAAIVYGGTADDPDLVVFAATNDGFVHAIDGDTGQELWAFIPKEHLDNLPNLYLNPDSAFKSYGVDGDIVPIVKDVDRDGVVEPVDGDFVYIMFGMRRGGSSYYLLDVTRRNSPQVKWRVSAAAFGQSWSRPTVARIDIDDAGLNADKAVVVIGGGYDVVHDSGAHPSTPDTQGAGIYFLDLETGNVLWRAGADVDADLQMAGMTRSIPTQVRVIDINGDRFADRMYAADMGGQILRFDIFNGKQPFELVTGGVLAQLGAEGLGSPTLADTRRFYNTPDVSLFNDNAQNRRFLAISIGSGYRSHPLDNSNSDRFYSIRDKNVFNQMSQAEYDTFTPYTEANLVEISGTVGTTIGAAQAGWKFTLPANQKVLATSTTFNNEVFFVAFSPDIANAETCKASAGKNFLYRVSVINGDPIADLDTIAPDMEDEARVTDLKQGGIASSPQFLFPSPEDDCTGDECSPPPIGCVGVECFDPGFVNNPVRTLWTTDGIQ